MIHSTLTAKGQTTIPLEVRQALRLKPGDRLAYVIQNGQVTLRPQATLASLAGSLRSDKGAGMTIDEIRAAAVKNALRERGKR